MAFKEKIPPIPVILNRLRRAQPPSYFFERDPNNGTLKVSQAFLDLGNGQMADIWRYYETRHPQKSGIISSKGERTATNHLLSFYENRIAEFCGFPPKKILEKLTEKIL